MYAAGRDAAARREIDELRARLVACGGVADEDVDDDAAFRRWSRENAGYDDDADLSAA